MTGRRFSQVDVFTTGAWTGNPVAVVHDAEGLEAVAMQRIARWTNLSETTFLLPPTDPGADYRLRIFTTDRELPFAGHPTLGSCHAWLAAGGHPRRAGTIVQECGAGLVEVRQTADGLAFSAPPLVRSGPVAEPGVAHIAELLGIERSAVVDSQWVDNGPGWVGVLLGSAAQVLALRPAAVDLDIGVIGPHPPGSAETFEVRAFVAAAGTTVEDPVTGSLNASLAGWLTAAGRATPPYAVSQGSAIGRRGRVWITCDDAATIWTGGAVRTRIQGHVDVS